MAWYSRGVPDFVNAARCASLATCRPRLGSHSVMSRYEITYTSFSISLRLLMPFRNVSAQLIL
jgi:hypothetical protein